MSRSVPTNPSLVAVGFYQIILVAVSLIAIVASFVLANSTSELTTKSRGFSAIIVAYLLSCFLFYYLNSRGRGEDILVSGTTLGDEEIDEHLFAIEEANEYFGGSLKSGDVFRLVANKVNHVLPFSACILFVIDRSAGKMTVVQAQGENADNLRNVETDLGSGLAGRCVQSRLVQIDRGTPASGDVDPVENAAGSRSSAAIPLIRSGEVFAVLQFFSNLRTAFDGNSVSILEAIGERVTPLILGSMSFERSITNALTDPVTEFPNERAFQLILENQIAETQRNRDERPLTIIALDIKGFDQLNLKYGHSTGDRILSLTGHAIKGQLRQMDFFARASNDEFLIILPTANEQIASEVIGRINTNLISSQFFVNDVEPITPELNFGTAAFGVHGESAEPLILAARLRKQQAKAGASGKVVLFPEKFVN